MITKTGFIKRTILFALVIFLAIPVGTAFSKAPYKIGYVNSHSGFLAHMGSAHRDGFLLCVEEINQSGGINGHKLDVVVYDDESDVTKGVLAFKRLLSSDKVMMVVGNNHSGIGIQCSALAEKNKLPYIMVGASRWGVVKPGKWKPPAQPTAVYDYVVKFWLDETAQLPALYNYAKKLGAKKIAWMHPGYPFGRSGHKYLMASHKAAGFDLVAAEEYGPRDSDMTVQLTKIKSKDFDILIIYGAEPAGALAYKQAREMGIKKPILSSISLGTRSLLDTMGQHMVGLILPMFVTEAPGLIADKNKAMVPLIEKMDKGIRAKHGHRGDWLNGEGYDSALLMADALRRANPDPANLKEAKIKIQKALVTTKDFVGTLAMGDLTSIHEMPLPLIMLQIVEGKKYQPAK